MFFSKMKNLSSVLTEQVSIRICGLCSYESTGLSMLLFSNSVMPNSLQPHGLAHQASLTTISWILLKLMFIESVMPSNHLILCHPLLLLPSTFPSIRVFSNDLALRSRWPKDWSFGFSISPSNEYSELISFRIDWFDLLAVQETLKSLLRHRNSVKVLVLPSQ